MRIGKKAADNKPEMRINLMKKGDQVIGIYDGAMMIRRRNGEVDLIRLDIDPEKEHVAVSKILTIGYGDDTVRIVADNGSSITYF